MEWKYLGKEMTTPIDNRVGFIYCIEFLEGDYKKYIGKKNFYSTRKRNFGKKEIALLKDKRLKRYEYVTKESDWRAYTSSNKEVNERIKRGDAYSKAILEFCVNKKHLTYCEEATMYRRGVLWDDRYYNDNIAGRFYTKDIEQWEQIRK